MFTESTCRYFVKLKNKLIFALLVVILLAMISGCSGDDVVSLKPFEADELFGGIDVGITETDLLSETGIEEEATIVEGKRMYSHTVIDDEYFFVRRGYSVNEDNIVDAVADIYELKLQNKEFTEEEISENFRQSVNNIRSLAEEKYSVDFGEDIFTEYEHISVNIGEKTTDGMQINIFGSNGQDDNIGKFTIQIAVLE